MLAQAPGGVGAVDGEHFPHRRFTDHGARQRPAEDDLVPHRTLFLERDAGEAVELVDRALQHHTEPPAYLPRVRAFQVEHGVDPETCELLLRPSRDAPHGVDVAAGHEFVELGAGVMHEVLVIVGRGELERPRSGEHGWLARLEVHALPGEIEGSPTGGNPGDHVVVFDDRDAADAAVEVHVPQCHRLHR